MVSSNTLIHYDENSGRQGKNSGFLRRVLNGIDILDCMLCDFPERPGVETLILQGNYAGVLINALLLDPNSTRVADTAILKQSEDGLEKHSNIILLGRKSDLEEYVADYGVQVIHTDNGYLQSHHLPEIRTALQNIIQIGYLSESFLPIHPNIV